ncbi:hypothetical protein TcCL_Unassigned00070 [Trypanosoma cruzi]|nr:hypothetical protein TcCL_Unassigned00070 [Trypanosoma cruzi]
MCTPPQICTSLDAACMTCGFVARNVLFLPQTTTKKKGWPWRSSTQGNRSGQTGWEPGIIPKIKKGQQLLQAKASRSVHPSSSTLKTSSTEQMQQTHVQHNIFRCPALNLTSLACHGGDAGVTSGMTPKYQAPCCGGWMLNERARVST